MCKPTVSKPSKVQFREFSKPPLNHLAIDSIISIWCFNIFIKLFYFCISVVHIPQALILEIFNSGRFKNHR